MFSWTILGVRRGLMHHNDIAANTHFIPRISDMPFMTGLPELQAVLIGNGTLNEDGTPNRATADRMGWELKTRAEYKLEAEERKFADKR